MNKAIIHGVINLANRQFFAFVRVVIERELGIDNQFGEEIRGEA